MAKKLTLNIYYCVQCPHHRIKPDPDPSDSFNYDDEKIVCSYMNDLEIEIGLRPYQTKNVEPPSWCPL